MADLLSSHYLDWEKSEHITILLHQFNKLCAVPNCNQTRSYASDTPYCYAHDKEKKGMIDLDTHYRGVV